MKDPSLVRRFQRLRNLLRSGQRLVDGDRTACNAPRQILAFHEFHHQERSRRRS